MSEALNRLAAALDRMGDEGRVLRLWWRDDDAVAPSPALDRLLALSGATGVPCLLAVIPEGATQALAERLDGAHGIHVAVHGWSHRNHAPDTEKKQELGAHRPVARTLGELAVGLNRLEDVFGARLTPILVPPWNRIAPEVVAGLPALGYRALSVFGPERCGPLPQINTHVDLIDWRGTRGGRDDAALVTDVLAAAGTGVRDIGLLTHHLVHDAAAWSFLERFLALTAEHPACLWQGAPALLEARLQEKGPEAWSRDAD